MICRIGRIDSANRGRQSKSTMNQREVRASCDQHHELTQSCKASRDRTNLVAHRSLPASIHQLHTNQCPEDRVKLLRVQR